MTSRSLQRWTRTIESWEAALGNLGQALVAFQVIEEALTRCIGALVARDRQLGEIVTAELSFRGRIAVFQGLLLHRTKLATLPADAREIIARVHIAEQRRNQLVHSNWDMNPKKPGTVARFKLSIKGRKGVERALEEIEPADLGDLVGKWEGIADDLLWILNVYAPDYAKRVR